VLGGRNAAWKDPGLDPRRARIGQPKYAGWRPTVLYLHGRANIDAQPPRVLQDNCDGLVPFSELNGLADAAAFSGAAEAAY
jgi:hypothetical protein